MNELLQQFVIESRELAESAIQTLERIEQAPLDPAQLDEVLRVLHTLKGSAGIVDFAAMGLIMHAAEELFGRAEDGTQPITAIRVGQCRTYLDLVLRWLERIEQSGRLPERAESEAEQTLAGFELSPAIPQPAVATGGPPLSVWLEAFAQRHPEAHARARSALRFVPAADCFYRGEDPLTRVLNLPDLLLLDCAAALPWEPLEQLDPFNCNLILTAFSAAPAAAVSEHLSGHSGRCEVVSVEAAAPAALPPLPAIVADVIGAQAALLTTANARDFVGRVASAGVVAVNALRYCGRAAQAELLAQASERSLLEQSMLPLQQALAQLLADPGAAPAAHRPSASAALAPAVRSVRIDAERVDALVRLAGEFAVLKNAIGHIVKLASSSDPALAVQLKERHGTLEHLVSELQRAVLGMRVRPLRTVLQRFPRLVREIATSLGKSVTLVIEGDGTEADKAIVEMLFEPLLHLVRNAIDHGIEPAAQRAASGKPPAARVQIRAQRLLDQIVIEVSDDGAGIDAARVAAVAQARGLLSEQQLQRMTEAQVIELIFAPGFSTAPTVTQVSGRGVGMDAVRAAVERVGGRVALSSRRGHGTTVTLWLPFSVMLTHVMTVEAAGQVFGLPLEVIIETLRVPSASIRQVGAARAVVVRERTLPLVDLATLVGAESGAPLEADITLVVVAANGEWGGIRVDRVLERLDLTLKPLDGLLAGTPGIAGTTLLGDGRVLLVLDIAQMLQ